MIALLLLLATAEPRREATAEPRRYAIVIGNNARPLDSDERLETLRYADDDAAAFFDFVRETSDEVWLLSLLDAATQRRHPDAARAARSPTLQALRTAVEALAAHLAQDARANRTSEVRLFFSGHGAMSRQGVPFLALEDGALTQSVLYDEVLSRLPASVVHLFVDACYADAVVRARGDTAESVAVDPALASRFSAERSLRRFSNVGAVIATSSAQKAHEWSEYEHGVFTYELLSALRGSADVNGDSLVEYSELAAFIAAANREVKDSRARLQVLSRPPPVQLRAPLVDLRRFSNSGWASYQGEQAERLSIEDERGARLMDVHGEAGFRMRFLLPRERTLFVRARAGEARFQVGSGSLDLRRLSYSEAKMSSRGAMAQALHAGLFAAAYGPIYYRAFTDASDGVSVDFFAPPPPESDVVIRRRAAATGLFITAGAAAAGALVLGGFTIAAQLAYQRTSFERASAEALAQERTFGIATAVAGSAAIAIAAVGLGIFPWGSVQPSIVLLPGGASASFSGAF